jgi:rod shape determining protein RodA
MSSRTKKNDVFLVPYSDVKTNRSVITNILCVLFVICIVLGLTNLYSASLGAGFFQSQLRNMVVTLSAFFIIGWVIPIKKVGDYAYYLLAIVCILLFIVDVAGKTVGGSQRWIALGPLTFQPSEFAKVTIAIVVARFFSSNQQDTPYTIRDLLPLGGMVGIVFALIYAQPDLGTAGVCLMIAAAQVCFIRIDVRSFRLVLLSAPIAAAVIFQRLLPYQRLRVMNFFSPDYDPSGTGYQSKQSIIAVGNGGAFGKGFAQGTQAHLKFLPERHTDFIFSVFAEEHGFWAGCVVFIIFGFLGYMSLVVARQSRDTFGGMLAIGVGALLFIEFAINVSMGMGIFPVVGIPLPFFSFGSSAMLTVCVSVGLLVAISRANSNVNRNI